MPTIRYMPDDGTPSTIWSGRIFLAGQGMTVRSETLLANLPEGFKVERTSEDRAAGLEARKRFDRYKPREPS